MPLSSFKLILDPKNCHTSTNLNILLTITQLFILCERIIMKSTSQNRTSTNDCDNYDFNSNYGDISNVQMCYDDPLHKMQQEKERLQHES